MDRCYIFRLLLLLTGLIGALLPILCHGHCNYPAIFNFGDSSSDTGAIHFIFPNNELAENPPYGRTYFGKPVNRYSDGRLSIDFFVFSSCSYSSGYAVSESILAVVDSNFGHGANFAASGATARDVSFIAPVYLTVQINQFKVFKKQVLDSITKHGARSFLPSADAFDKGIYIVEIGGNDFSYGYKNLKQTPSQVKQTILPAVAKDVAAAVKELYNEGARTILVKDVGPQGCQPFWLTYFGHSPNDFDRYNCSISYNDAVRYYNGLLKGEVASLQGQLKGAKVIYVNTYAILYDFIANPSRYGFKQTTRACCGVGGKHNFDYAVQCGSSGTIAGHPVKAVSCANPDTYVNWDGVHWTDQANRFLTKQILSGKYFEPAFSIASQCDIHTF